ncbi:hypothetical protein [Campylobacter sp. RM16187]|uniref:hypothetical protein n=1 Tax=Campylobacter sp. RM16187 TaxID=1660063 RepID=UPI0021B595DA|nr:hypothetical protein [Campylobacter sp. RM16187]QKG29475.1 hypothetical protein CDOMF_1221 [Campylobacter sp. RM16187]
MSKILAVFFMFFLAFANAVDLGFSEQHLFELKKDEWARVFVTEKGAQDRDSFEFRWTLFDNTNIILHTRYRNYPRQLVMSLRRGLSLYKQSLIPDFRQPPMDIAWLYLEFENFKDGKGFFKVYIKDDQKRLDVEFLDPVKR